MKDDKKTGDNVNIPLSWLVYPGTGNGAAGRAFPTIPAPPEKPPHLSHTATKPAELSRQEPPAQSGLKGGDEEC